ncbi:MAG TPA: glycosyltransferase [Chthoniobacterales bacterium]|jgi:processive 1,2-diacylglycerol beta-glucosyltransferase|nr:glycosyltransferase [Chthoniobacterales bacterium]
MKKRVLIISTSAGTGHVRAGEALTKVFEEHPMVGEVVHSDALDFTNKVFRDFYSKLYARLVQTAPEFLGWWYKQSDEPWKTDGMRLMLDRLNTGPLVKFIRQFNPHITVCTHFMPAGIISHLIAKSLLDAHLSIVVTDLDFHAMWLSRVFHRYFVAIEETKVHLEELGLPKERITVSGIPIDPEFATPIDRVATRFEYGLHPTRPTMLLSAGALGAGPAEFVVERLKNLRSKAQTIVVCGRSPETRDRVLQLVGPNNVNFKVFGYTTRMPDLMKISDLFIGKPGGLTTAEALACGLPMVIVSPIPGQEERNSDHLLEEGVAVKCNEMTTIPYKIDTLLDDPIRVEEMRRKAFALSRPDAARTIVRTLVADEVSALEMTDDEAEAITIAASKERDTKTR